MWSSCSSGYCIPYVGRCACGAILVPYTGTHRSQLSVRLCTLYTAWTTEVLTERTTVHRTPYCTVPFRFTTAFSTSPLERERTTQQPPDNQSMEDATDPFAHEHTYKHTSKTSWCVIVQLFLSIHSIQPHVGCAGASERPMYVVSCNTNEDTINMFAETGQKVTHTLRANRPRCYLFDVICQQFACQ